MQITGMSWGAQLLNYVGYPTPEVLGPDATREQIKRLIDRYGKILIKPIFKGGVGKKGKAGLIGFATDVDTAMREKERLFFVEHRVGNIRAKADGVTFEGAIPAEHEIYVSITDDTRYRAPTLTITHHGGVDIEELSPDQIATIPFDALTGFKGFIVANALDRIHAPKEIISPLVQNLPKLWDLYESYGMSTIELNPIRLKRVGTRYVPVACDVKAAFDQDNPASKRIGLPPTIFQSNITAFEAEINRLRTYQGQSDVLELNPNGSILPFMFGGGANSAATETLGSKAIFSSDFGGNPPYEKMYDIARISLKHHWDTANVLLVIGGKANNTDIYVTFRGIFDALRDHIAENGWKPIYVVVGRGGPNLIKGMVYARDILDGLKLPYKMFGYDTSMILTLEQAKKIDDWWASEGRDKYAESVKNSA